MGVRGLSNIAHTAIPTMLISFVDVVALVDVVAHVDVVRTEILFLDVIAITIHS